MKKKTSKTNIEACEWIVNLGDCDGDCHGNCFPSVPCPLNTKDKYSCSNFDTVVLAAKKFLDDHISDEEEEKEKKRTSEENIEICKAIVEIGDCHTKCISCSGKPGSMFEGHDCPLHKGEYGCCVSVDEEVSHVAQRVLEDHEAGSEEIPPEERVKLNLQDMTKGYFWGDSAITDGEVFEGYLVRYMPEYTFSKYTGVVEEGRRVVSFANYSETRPELDPWVEINVEQGFKLLNTDTGIIKGQGFLVDSWVDAELDFVSNMFHTQSAVGEIIDSEQFRVRKALLVKHGLWSENEKL